MTPEEQARVNIDKLFRAKWMASTRLQTSKSWC